MSKPKKLAGAAIKRDVLIVGEVAGWLAARSSRLSAASDWIDDGRKGIDYSAVRRGGGESSTGPERAAIDGRTDDVGRMAGEFSELLAEWVRTAKRLKVLGVKLAVEWTPESLAAAEGVARRSMEPAGAGECANCKRLVSGSAIDRLRNGRCDPCRKYWDRNGTERPKPLWGGDSIDDQCRASLTRGATDYRCTLRVGHEGDHQFDAENVA